MEGTEGKNPRGVLYSLSTHAKGRDASTRLVGQLTCVVLPGNIKNRVRERERKKPSLGKRGENPAKGEHRWKFLFD